MYTSSLLTILKQKKNITLDELDLYITKQTDIPLLIRMLVNMSDVDDKLFYLILSYIRLKGLNYYTSILEQLDLKTLLALGWFLRPWNDVSTMSTLTKKEIRKRLDILDKEMPYKVFVLASPSIIPIKYFRTENILYPWMPFKTLFNITIEDFLVGNTQDFKPQFEKIIDNINALDIELEEIVPADHLLKWFEKYKYPYLPYKEGFVLLNIYYKLKIDLFKNISLEFYDVVVSVKDNTVFPTTHLIKETKKNLPKIVFSCPIKTVSYSNFWEDLPKLVKE